MSDNIKVVVKVRPLIAREVEDGAQVLWRARNNTLTQLDASGRDISPLYTFDQVYDKSATTEEVYNDIAKPIVEAAIAGINGTIFAYGQTSSGKTYTMMGNKDSPGIIPLAISDIFERIKNVPSRDFLLRVSYIEIYNETIKDLLNTDKKNIKVHETPDGSVKLDSTEEVRTTPEEVLDIMKQGEANRHMGDTNMNEQSSRSHTIFQITIESREHSEEGEETDCVNVSQLNLVDLAGSERSGQTGATGLRFREGTLINKSLSTLGLVIKQLSEEHKFVNYRDSKLTRILQNSLGGNAKTSIICAITPAAGEESVSTLQFATRAKAIKNKPEVNAVVTSATMLKSLTKKLAGLQYELESKKHLEYDNVRLQQMITKLKKHIMFGMTRPSERVDRRKTWCAPRRATISTLMPIQEENVVAKPRFCTPHVQKYSEPAPTEFVTVKRPSNIPEGSDEEEEPVTPPQRRKNVDFTAEVITLDDTDDENEKLCSPYHRCYDTSKTPPCVLRDKAKKAEISYNDLIELTDREKIYSPKTGWWQRMSGRSNNINCRDKSTGSVENSSTDSTELMDRIDKHSSEIGIIRDELDKAKELCKEKDKEIATLNEQNTKYEQDIKEIQSLAVGLEKTCEDYKIKLTDLEVCLENCKVKAKHRETELLCLLEEKNIHSKRHSLDKSQMCEKISLTSELSGFMNLSKDISLVDSDNEASLASLGPEKVNHNDDINLLQAQINEQNDLIRELNKKHNNCHQNIKMYCEELESCTVEKTNLQLTISDFKEKVENLSVQLETANQDINSYKNLVTEMKIQLHSHDFQMEEKITENNEELSMILRTFKNALTLKKNDSSTCLGDCREIMDLKNKQIVMLESDICELQRTVDCKLQNIENLTKEKLEILQINNKLVNQDEKLKAESLALAEETEKLKCVLNETRDLINCKDKQLKEYIEKQKELYLDIESRDKSINDCISENKSLLEKINMLNNTIENMDNKASTLEEKFTKQNEKLMAESLALAEETEKLKCILNETRDLIYQKDKQLEEYIIKQKELHLDIETQKKSILDSVLENKSLLKKIDVLNNIIEDKDNKASTLEEKFANEVKILKCQVDSQNEKLIQVSEASYATLSENESLKAKFVEIEFQLRQLEEDTSKKYKMVKNLQQNLEERLNKAIAQENILTSQIEHLLEIQKHMKEELERSSIQQLNNNELELQITQLKIQLVQKQEEVENLTYEIDIFKQKLLHLQQDFEELTVVRDERNKLSETIGNKNLEINTLHLTMNDLKTKIADLSNHVFEADQLRHEIKEKEKLLRDIGDKVWKLVKIIDVPNYHTNVLDIDYINELLAYLEEYIIKQHATSTVNSDHVSSIEEQLMMYTESIKTLQIKIQGQDNCIQSLNNTCYEKTMEIDRLTELNNDFNNDLLKRQNLIDDLKSELLNKSTQLNNICDNVQNLERLVFHQLTTLDNSMAILEKTVNHTKEAVTTLQTEVKLKNGEKFSKLPTLRELSLMKVNIELLKHTKYELITENNIVSTGTQMDTQLTNTNEVSASNLISKLESENTQLALKVHNLEKTNQNLKLDYEGLTEEVKMLLELASELYKQISKHRTYLSTLTATTYAENKLLKSKVKALHHHHDRLYSVCQREVPELREQLCKLQHILHSESTHTNLPLTVVNQCESVMKDLGSPDNQNTEISLSKFSMATLGSDTLMLGNNFTLGPSANSTMISQEDARGGSATICENLDVTGIPQASEISCQTDEQCQPALVSIKITNDGKSRKCCDYDVEAFRTIALEYKKSDGLSEVMKKELEEHSENCILKKYHSITNHLHCKEKEIEVILQTVESMKREKTYLEERVKQMKILEDEVCIKATEIKNLSHTVENMKTEIARLQNENETLSNEVMENILENDALKNELAKKKNENTFQKQECLECVRKDEIILSKNKYETSEENILCYSNKMHASLSEDLSKDSLRHEKICSVRNELQASQEECMKIKDEVSTMRDQLAKNEELTLIIQENLKNTVLIADNSSNLIENICEDKSTQNIDTVSIECYENDKRECLNFIVSKEIGDTEHPLPSVEKPIIDMIKYLYGTLWTKHTNELENLTNKIKQFEEEKSNLQMQINDLSKNYESANKKWQAEIENRNILTTKLNMFKENNTYLQTKFSALDNTESDLNAKYVILSQSMLKPLDEEFQLSTSQAFECLITELKQRYENDLTSTNAKCSEFENHVKSLTDELNTVNEDLISVKKQFTENKNELELLKLQKEKMYQISNVVTKNLVMVEEKLKKLITDSAHTLIGKNIISEADIDYSLPTIEIVAQMYSVLSIKVQALVDVNKETSVIGELNVKNLEERVQSVTREVLAREEEIIHLKAENQQNIERAAQYESLMKKLQHDNNIQAQIGENLKVELCSTKNDLSGCINKINYLEQQVLLEKLEKIKQLELEYSKLQSINLVLMNENTEFTKQLEIGVRTTNEHKKELEDMRQTLEQVQDTNKSLVNSLEEWKAKTNTQCEELTLANKELEEKREEILLLERNIKTHQRTTDIQANMYKRLQKEKEDLEYQLKEKSDLIEHLTFKCDVLQTELDDLRSIKNTIELQLGELPLEMEGVPKSGRSSLDTVKTETRRRRQSVHDLQRTIADINEDPSPEQMHPENIFGNCMSSRDLFSDSKPGSQRNSIESASRLDFKNTNFPSINSENACESEESRGGVTLRRRRRQSIHDLNRTTAVKEMLGSKEDVSPVDELETENKQLKMEIAALKANIESGNVTDDYYKGELERLKVELESCRKAHEELEERYRELDEECEMCAENMRERNEHCLKLGREKMLLEKQLAEMKKRQGGGDAQTNTTRQTSEVAVNTDIDWKKLHSAVVDRMSYDAEVEKRKKLVNSFEELRIRYKESKETIAKLLQQIEDCRPTNDTEVHRLKCELDKCRRQQEELQQRYKELDEECEMCAKNMRERDEQCVRLGQQKLSLEAKVTELQQMLSTNPMVHSARKKRQSCHDMNRDPGPGRNNASTNTDGGALSALGVDQMTHEAEKERRRRLQIAYEAVKAKNSELNSELRRLQQTKHVDENTVDMLQLAPVLDKDLIRKQHLEIQQLSASLEELRTKNHQMRQQLQSMAIPPPSPALLMPPPPATILVATGSAIVQNQQLCDYMKENERLKKMNAKLVNLCKKRGKLGPDQENFEPQT